MSARRDCPSEVPSLGSVSHLKIDSLDGISFPNIAHLPAMSKKESHQSAEN